MRVFGELRFAAFLFLSIGLTAASAASNATSKTTAIVYTNGLGTFLSGGTTAADRSRTDVVAKRLKELRAKYKDAIFVDGGDAVGPMVGNESPFGLPLYRIFDEARYAASGLSARDGLHSFSFFRFLPPGAKIATPLVGTFDLPKSPPGESGFYEIHPAWATAITSGGAKLQVFGVATTTSLTGVVEPLSDINTGGPVAKQARYVLDHLSPGHVPIILSNMTPAENDELARLINGNALLFEGGYPWRLIVPPANQKQSRDVGPVRILSHLSPTAAAVVTLPSNLECMQARVVVSESLWESKSFPSPGRLSSLFGGPPIEARLVHSLFTNPLYLPDVGTSVGKRSLLQEIMIPYDDKDVQRTPPPGEANWQQPRWMMETRNLRGNEIVYRYGLYLNKKFMAHVYRVRHALAPPFSMFDMLVAVDKDHRLKRIRVFFPPGIANRGVKIEPLCERLLGKKCDEIKLEDWPERGGAEFVVDNFVRDVQMLLAFDEAAR